MGLHSKGRKTDMKTAAKRERKTLRIVELALLLGAAAFLMPGVWALNTQRDLRTRWCGSMCWPTLIRRRTRH